MQGNRGCLALLLWVLAMSGATSASTIEPAATVATTPVSGMAAIAEAAARVRDEAGTHRLILLGEMHGTREGPELVAALVAAYAADGPVVLGLEMPRGEHAAFRRYLDSDGDGDARAELRAGPFWAAAKDNQHDGRRNEDALDLIESLRILRASGRDVAILPIDLAIGQRHTTQQRDRSMAQRVRAGLMALPRGRLLVLTGNVHAMQARPAYAPAQMQTPMGAYLRDLAPYSVNVLARSGHFWACREHKCGPAAASAPPHTERSDDGVYQLNLVLPRFTVARLLGASH